MWLNCKITYFVIGLFVSCFFTKAGCLQCYSCNVSTSQFDDNACMGIGSLRKCPASSVCLSATYEVNTGEVKTHNTMRTCFQNMAGQECDHFIKGQENMLFRSASITPSTCYTCEKDNCNRRISPSSSSGSTPNYLSAIISSILCLCIFRILKY